MLSPGISVAPDYHYSRPYSGSVRVSEGLTRRPRARDRPSAVLMEVRGRSGGFSQRTRGIVASLK